MVYSTLVNARIFVKKTMNKLFVAVLSFLRSSKIQNLKSNYRPYISFRCSDTPIWFMFLGWGGSKPFVAYPSYQAALPYFPSCMICGYIISISKFLYNVIQKSKHVLWKGNEFHFSDVTNEFY